MTDFQPTPQTPEQVNKRKDRSQRLRELYDAARKARENVND